MLVSGWIIIPNVRQKSGPVVYEKQMTPLPLTVCRAVKVFVIKAEEEGRESCHAAKCSV